MSETEHNSNEHRPVLNRRRWTLLIATLIVTGAAPAGYVVHLAATPHRTSAVAAGEPADDSGDRVIDVSFVDPGTDERQILTPFLPSPSASSPVATVPRAVPTSEPPSKPESAPPTAAPSPRLPAPSSPVTPPPAPTASPTAPASADLCHRGRSNRRKPCRGKRVEQWERFCRASPSHRLCRHFRDD